MANRPNYVKQMDEVLAGLAGSRPRLLLHACCAPCSSSVLEVLERHFAVSVYYYNPNTWPEAEYTRRLAELRRFLAASGRGALPLIEEEYRPAEFYAAAAGLEAEPERGARCTACYRLRMERAAAYAAAHGYGWFCTTLSLSPHKDAVRINQIGQELARQYGVRHLPSEFKKRDGYKRSLELSAGYGLYRQDYCGCEFSAREAARRREAPSEGEAPPGQGRDAPGRYEFCPDARNPALRGACRACKKPEAGAK